VSLTPPSAQPALTSTASTPAVVGSPLIDTAHLSAGNAPTGAISFELYGPDDASCTSAPVFTTTSVVAGNGNYVSAPFTPTAAGAYRWRATYSGDAQNAPAGPTTCGDPTETVVAGKARPELMSTAKASAELGNAISDTASLTGGSAPTGAMTSALYGPNDDTCSGIPVFTTQVQVTGPGDYPSPRFTPVHAGDYHWVALYSGDANNDGAGPTTCGENGENSTVLRAETTIFSLASGATSRRLAANRLAGATGGRIRSRPRRVGTRFRAAGLPIHDTVHLSGGIDPGGFVHYELYGPDDVSCSGQPVFVTETGVSGNGDYLSASFVPTASGVYRWVAKYSGDADNAPAGPTPCGEPGETVVVTLPAKPALSSSASGAVTLGGAVRDTAHLSGGRSPAGAITFRLYGPGDDTCSKAPVFISVVPVSENGDYDSAEFTPKDDGTYRWVVRYSGDSSNDSVGPTPCGAEAELVDVRTPAVKPAQPDFSTTGPSASAALGTPVYDVANLSGGSAPTGVISFELYGPDDTTCAAPPAFTSQVEVARGGRYASAPYVVSRPGTYRWVASYSGDRANKPAGPTACGSPAETFTVSDAPSPNPNPPLPNPTPNPKPERGQKAKHPKAKHRQHKKPKYTG
jgi:hypothetical protein